MTDLRIVTAEGSDAILEDAAVQHFAAELRGKLLRPGDGEYDAARIVWNGMIDRRPALIARCVGVADVIASVRFARIHGVLVSVRGGGHNITGNAVCEGGLMIDLSPMKSVRVDLVNQTARAEAGLTWGWDQYGFDSTASTFVGHSFFSATEQSLIDQQAFAARLSWSSPRRHGVQLSGGLTADHTVAALSTGNDVQLPMGTFSTRNYFPPVNGTMRRRP